MLIKIFVAGSGGQGVLTIGNVLGNAAMIQNYFTTFLPAYGAAMRGGTANCTVCVSDEEVASPIASKPDVLVAMNQPSLIAYISSLEPGGQLLYNENLVDFVPERGDIEMFAAPINAVAHKMGSERSANMVMLGALVQMIKIIKIKTVFESIEMMMGSKKKAAESSIRAIQAGYDGFPFK
jgi:2-oxoglutarate ferredoxin oxidoreductase subunit gamma